jgi:hypothetical protein
MKEFDKIAELIGEIRKTLALLNKINTYYPVKYLLEKDLAEFEKFLTLLS